MNNFLDRFVNLVYKLRPISLARSVFNMVSKIYVNPDSAMQVAAFWRGVTYITGSIANLPVEIKDKKNVILENDRVSYLLNVQPNPEMNAHVFKLLATACAIIHGNFYAEIERDIFGRPVYIWPIWEFDIVPYRDESGVFFYRVIGGSRVRAGEDSYLLPKDVLHIRNIYTKNGFVGEGVVSYGKTALGISLNADNMASSIYANMGMPTGIISVDGALSKDARERFKEQWKAANGRENIGGTAVLENGAKFTPINITPDVLQFLESRKFGVLEIARFLGVPPTKLYDGDSSSYNNIEHNNLEVATDTLNTWCRIWEAEIDMKLLNGQFAGKYTEFDLYDVFRGDMDKRSQYYTRLFNIGAMNSNEIRIKEGKAPYKEGDKFYVASNNLTPVERLGEIIDANIESKKSKTETTPNQNSDTNDQELTQAIKNYLER